MSLRIRSRKVCFAPIKQVLRLHRNNNMFNPYIAGNPVGGDTAFIGRQDVLREVTRVLANPSTNAIVLYEHQRISLSKACEIGGFTLWEFFELNRQLAIDLPYTADDLHDDLARLAHV